MSFVRICVKFCFRACLLAMPLASCSYNYKTKNYNETFEKKYGKEVERIRLDRVPDKKNDNEVVKMEPPTDEELRAMNNRSGENHFSYVDVSKFGERQPQEYLPNGEVYQQVKSKNPSNSLPDGMFEVSYDTRLYPAFRRAGAEFDRIRVPSTDVYGVETELSEKSYILVGNKSLQKNIDQMISEKTDEDVKISQMLIDERRKIRKESKMKEIFGDDISSALAFNNDDQKQLPRHLNNKKEVQVKLRSSDKPSDQKKQVGIFDSLKNSLSAGATSNTKK